MDTPASALFHAAYAPLSRDASLDARLRRLFPAAPASPRAFLAAARALQLAPPPHVAQALAAQFEPDAPTPAPAFERFRHALAYAAFVTMHHVNDGSHPAPHAVARPEESLRDALEHALLQAERRFGTPKRPSNTASPPPSPPLTDDFFTPREKLPDPHELLPTDQIAVPAITPDRRREELPDHDVWYTPRPERNPDRPAPQLCDGRAPTSSRDLRQFPQLAPSPSTPSTQADRRDSFGAPDTAATSVTLCPGVASDALHLTTGASDELVRTDLHTPVASPSPLHQYVGESPSDLGARLPQELPAVASGTIAVPPAGDDSQHPENVAGRSDFADEPFKQGNTPSSSASTSLDNQQLSDADDQTVSDESLDGTLPAKLHAGIASAPSACQPDSDCKHPEGDEAGFSENLHAGAAFNAGDVGDAEGTMDHEDQRTTLIQGTGTIAERSGEDEDTISGRSIDEGLSAKLQVGVSSTVSPVDIKVGVESAQYMQDLPNGHLREGPRTGSSPVTTFPDITNLSEDDKENASSCNNLTAKIEGPPKTDVTVKSDTLVESRRQSQMANAPRAHAGSSDRRKSCTLDSGELATEGASALGEGGAAAEPSTSTVKRQSMDMLTQTTSVAVGGPKASTGHSPALTADAGGKWSLSTCAASRALEEEIQAGEADMPAWGRSPAGWAAPCCDVVPSPGSHFESPVLGSSSPLRDSARKLCFSSSDGEDADDGRSTSTLSLGTRDTLRREVERYVREAERWRQRNSGGGVDGVTLEAVTLDVSDESELTPAGFDAVRKLRKASCVVEEAIGSAVSTRGLSERHDMTAVEVGTKIRLEEVLEAVRESVEVCKEVREELGLRRRARRLNAGVWVMMLVGIGVGICVNFLRGDAFVDALV